MHSYQKFKYSYINDNFMKSIKNITKGIIIIELCVFLLLLAASVVRTLKNSGFFFRSFWYRSRECNTPVTYKIMMS
jgi:hypothetical protein